jgi:hypothetical protein
VILNATSAPGWIYLVVFGPMIGSAAFVGVRWATLRNGPCDLTSRLGPANWDFSKSWGSNITVLGALLGTLLASGALPDPPSIPKPTYAGLNVLFGVLVLVAPLVYTATQSPVEVHMTNPNKEPQYQGYVGSFLVSSAVTIWAVVGELITVALLFREIERAKSLPTGSLWLLYFLVAVAGILLAFYAWRTMRWILERQCNTQALRTAKQADLQARFGATAPAVAAVEPALPAWPLM